MGRISFGYINSVERVDIFVTNQNANQDEIKGWVDMQVNDLKKIIYTCYFSFHLDIKLIDHQVVQRYRIKLKKTILP